MTTKITGTTGQGLQITDIQAFAHAVKQVLGQTLPSAHVELHKITKNNNVTRTGLVLRRDGNMEPVVYLEDFFRQYQNGKPLDQICRKIKEILQGINTDEDFDMLRLVDFSDIRNKICFRLVNAEKNATRLKEIPHRLWKDLAIVYYVPVSLEIIDGHDFSGGITLNNRMIGMWDVDEPELYELARVNTPALFHAEIKPIADAIHSILTEMTDPETEISIDDTEVMAPLYVVTNAGKVNGAAVMLYEGILEKFANEVKSDFCIIPSSIHETLFLPVSSDADGRILPEIVREVNAECVAPEEVLSDNAYFYCAKDGCVRMAS